MLNTLETLKAELSQPADMHPPCGEDPKYEDDYAWLKEEIAKMGGMGSGGTQWELVGEKSVALLKKAKDLNLIAYVLLVWTRAHQLAGLVVGIELLNEIVEKWWEQMFPALARPKPRAVTLKWLQEKLGEQVSDCQSEDRALLARGIAAVSRLKDLIYDRFEDPPANFKTLQRYFEEWLARAPQQAPAVAQSEQAPAGEPVIAAEASQTAPAPVQQAAAAPAAPAAAATAAPAAPAPTRQRPAAKVEAPPLADDADLGALFDTLLKIAGRMQTAAPEEPIGYRLARMAQFHGKELPRHDDSKQTFFPAPATELSDALKRMAGKSAWQPLLAKVESLFLERWYWLDLQYYAGLAAEGLGAEELRAIIEGEAARLEERLPALKELRFNDGTPFATPQTRDWLQLAVKRAQAGGGGAIEEDPAKLLLSRLRKLGSDHFAEAMVVAQAGINGAPDRFTAFRMRCEIANFCIEAEQYFWADSLARSMIAQLEQHDLAYWVPAAAAEAWRIMLEVARELKETDAGYGEWELKSMRALAGLNLAPAGNYPKKKPQFG